MAHYAFLDNDNNVVSVIAGVDENLLDDLPEGFSSWEEWYGSFKGLTCKRTSYNTIANTHTEGGTPFRGNYAGIGYEYRTGVATLGVGSTDVFIPPQPYVSWTISTTEAAWVSPLGDAPALTDAESEAGKYYAWDESAYQADNTTGWVLTTPE